MQDERLDRRTTALILNDLVNAGLRRSNDPEHNQAIANSGLIPNTARLIVAVRRFEIPIFWIRVERRADRADVPDTLVDQISGWHKPNEPVVRGSAAAQLVDEFSIEPEDHEILKPRFDPFIGTDLDLRLRTRRVETLLLGGHSTNTGVESCARTAHDLGYNVVILSDCCFNASRDLHRFAIEHILPRFARIRSSDDVIAMLAS